MSTPWRSPRGYAGFALVELLKPRLKDQTSGALRLGVATGEGTRLIGADPSFARPELGDSVSSTWSPGCLWRVPRLALPGVRDRSMRHAAMRVMSVACSVLVR